MDLKVFIDKLQKAGEFTNLTTNPFVQFGTDTSPFIGHQLMPEQNKVATNNMFKEFGIRTKTMIANHGPRYSPPVKKGGFYTSSFTVELGDSDIAFELTTEDLDALIQNFDVNDEQSAIRFLDLVNKMGNLPFIVSDELMIWQAIVSASVVRQGDDYSETVALSNPSGHRTNAGGAWSDDTYDPFDDIYAKVDLLRGKGYEPTAIYAGSTVISLLAGNANVRKRTGNVVLTDAGQLSSVSRRASLDAINGLLSDDGIAAITAYNKTYETQTSTGFFLPRNVMVFVCNTGRDVTVTGEDGTTLDLANTLGYLAIGRAPGQNTPGRNIVVNAITNTVLPRVELEAKESSFPVVTEPEAIGVIGAIA